MAVGPRMELSRSMWREIILVPCPTGDKRLARSRVPVSPFWAQYGLTNALRLRFNMSERGIYEDGSAERSASSLAHRDGCPEDADSGPQVADQPDTGGVGIVLSSTRHLRSQS